MYYSCTGSALHWPLILLTPRSPRDRPESAPRFDSMRPRRPSELPFAQPINRRSFSINGLLWSPLLDLIKSPDAGVLGLGSGLG